MKYHLKSHPEKLLIEHLLNTANLAKKEVEKINFGYLPFNKKILEDITFLTVAFHDIGKATSFFQDYLTKAVLQKNSLKNHSLLSSIICYGVVTEYCKQNANNIPDLWSKILPYFSYLAVKRHHGELNDFKDEILIEQDEYIIKQISALQSNEVDEIFYEICKNVNLENVRLEQILDNIKNSIYVKESENFSFDFFDLGTFNNLDYNIKIEFYLYVLFLYGLLIYTDRTDVILNENFENQTNVTLLKVEQFRKENFNYNTNNISLIRNKIYNEVFEKLVSKFDKNNYIYTLTLPTGAGKTILSLSIALKLRELIENNNLKIIICIPFTSIIDQNYDVYYKIIQPSDSTTLLKHHHLVNISYKRNDDIYDYNQSELLIETWNSEIIITTFVQLFETLFTNDKRKLMKIKSIANSIIILDEIQSINYDLWFIVNKIFTYIGKIFNTYFILSTATQPLIFNNGEYTELYENNLELFNYFNRTRLIVNIEKAIPFDEYKILLKNYILENPTEDILIISNTKKITLELFEYLKYFITENEIIYYLSTYITPYERKQIIYDIINEKYKRKIIVSTQLVEAGVDISVKTIFREFAPLDSIIQSAGRANRNAEYNTLSNVFIYEIEENSQITKRLYGNDLILKTKRVFNKFGKNIIEENEYWKLANFFYNEIKDMQQNKIPDEFRQTINLEFDKIGKFSLIDEIKTESVYVVINDEAKNLLEQFKNIYTNENIDIFKKKELFGEIKNQFYNYVINVNIPFGQKEINIDCTKEFGFYIINALNGSDFYKYSPNNFFENSGFRELNLITI